MKRSELVFTAVKPPLDYLALICAALGAYFIRYLSFVQEIRPIIFDLPFKGFFQITLILGVAWVGILAMAGLYNIAGPKKFREEVARLFVASAAGMALVLAIMVFSRYLFDSRFIILAGWLLAFFFLTAERGFIHLIQRFAYRIGFGVHRVAIIGDGKIADELAKEFSIKPSLGYRVVERFSSFDNQNAQRLKVMAINNQIDEIIQINPNRQIDQTNELLNLITEYHLDFRYTADLLGTQLTNLAVTTLAGTPIVEVKKTRLDGWGRIYKRIFDLVFSLLLITIFSPIMLVTVLAIKLNSPGPILFSYRRIGQNGKPFYYFKFRSMVKDAHQLRFDREFLKHNPNMRDGSPMMKFQNDPRITKVGKFIRRFSIDELPELFLAFAGTMSLVGPRPHELEEVERYQAHHKKLLTIKPGITGLAQVSGRSDLDFEQEVKLDTYYIENWSIGLDLLIMLKTPWAIIKRRKAE